MTPPYPSHNSHNSHASVTPPQTAYPRCYQVALHYPAVTLRAALPRRHISPTPNQTAEQTQQQTTTAQGKTDFPISVTVEKQTADKPNQTQKWGAQEWDIFITGAGVDALSVEIVMVAGIGAYWLKCRKRRKHNEKRKNRTHTAHCLP